MKFTACRIPGVKFIELPVYLDSRGSFLPLIADRFHTPCGIPTHWAETNLSSTGPGVIRGLHYQEPNAQAKLITVVSGDIFDVIVDLRPESTTYGEFECFTLSAGGVRGPNQVFLPEGLAHGFATPHGPAMIVYQVSRPWSPDHEKLIPWNDERYAIPWPIQKPILSSRDAGEAMM